MNSKQRRKDKRTWKYSVTVRAKDFGHYEEMWEWLKMRHGTNVHKCGWRDRHPDIHYDDYLDGTFAVIWEFLDKKKAVEFTLRWS